MDDSSAVTGLQLQLATIAARAVESADPEAFLINSVAYHNVCEYELRDTGSIR